jgi:alkylhydroperoxidase/carboxymuconolactone decarboxylase family protein YurZ
MPYIPLEEHLPGITGLLEFRKDTAAPIRELTQVLMRGPSTLTEAERELIATIVSHRNDCKFCATAHTAAADVLIIASQVQQSGKSVSNGAIQDAKDAGATDIEIHDTVLIAALFCLYNRYVDGLATVAPNDPSFYRGLGERLKEHGYNRLPQGYDHLKNNPH